MQIPASVHQQCLKAGDLVPKAQNAGADCSPDEMNKSGNRVDWVMRCNTPQGPLVSRGSMTYQGESASAVR